MSKRRIQRSPESGGNSAGWLTTFFRQHAKYITRKLRPELEAALRAYGINDHEKHAATVTGLFLARHTETARADMFAAYDSTPKQDEDRADLAAEFLLQQVINIAMITRRAA